MAVLTPDDNGSATITANQAYVASGSKKSFADWLQEAKDSGLIEEGKDILASLFIKKPAGSTPPAAGKVVISGTGSGTILGMPKAVFYGITAVVVIGAGILIYKQMSKK